MGDNIKELRKQEKLLWKEPFSAWHNQPPGTSLDSSLQHRSQFEQGLRKSASQHTARVHHERDVYIQTRCSLQDSQRPRWKMHEGVGFDIARSNPRQAVKYRQ